MSESADDAGGSTDDQSVRRDVLGDDGAGADHGAFADGEPREDGSVGADRGAFLDQGREQRRRGVARARLTVVGERRVRSDEDVVLERHAIPKLDAAFDRDAVADDDLVLDEAMGARIARRESLRRSASTARRN